MPVVIPPPAPTKAQFAQLTKEVAYLNARDASAQAGLDQLWSDTYLDATGIDSGNSSQYTHRGASDYDVIRDTSTNQKLLAHFNDPDFLDSGNTGHGVASTDGDPEESTSQKKFGTKSLSLDGSDIILFTDHADWDKVDPGPFTIECWVYFNSTAGNKMLITSGDGNDGWLLWHDGSNLKFSYYNTGLTNIVSESWAPSTSTWYHVAMVRDGSSWYLFVDGTQLGTTTTSSPSYTAQTYGLVIGAQRFGGSYTNYLDGYIDEIRISDSARYTGNFTPSASAFTSDSNTLLLCHFESSLTDSSGSGLSLSLTGNAKHTGDDEKFGNGSIELDGSDGHLEVASFPAIGTSDFTIHFWVYMDTHSAEKYFFKLGGSNNFQMSWHTTAGGRLDLGIGGTTQSENYATSTGSWIHFAVVRESGTVHVYADGTEVGSGFSASGSITGSSTLYVGSTDSNTLVVDGKFDELEVKTEAMWSTNFTAPTSESSQDTAGDATIQTIQLMTLGESENTVMVFADFTNIDADTKVEVSMDNGSTWEDVSDNLDSLINLGHSGTQPKLKVTLKASEELEFLGLAVA